MAFGFNAPQGTQSGFPVPQGLPSEAAVAAITGFNPTSGTIAQVIAIGVENMPSGFTLNDITLNGVSLNSPTKNSEFEVQGTVTPGNSTGEIVVTYNTTETIDTSGLTPSVFTVT